MEFNISDVAGLLGIQRLTDGNSFGVVCPFCGDTRGKMNFRIYKDGTPANTYHCFYCGASGNMLTLYAELEGIYGANRYKIAYREIREKLGRSEFVHSDNRSLPIYGENQEEQPASIEQKDLVYRHLLSFLTLSDVHRKELLRRGFTEEQIETCQFRSTPAYGTESLARKLLKDGMSLAGIPGFFMNGRRNWDISFYRRNRGFLCPAYTIDGKIAGFQIRLDEPYDGRKYLWFSSANKARGTGSKSPVTFLGDPYSRVVRVTEGILKPLAAYCLSGLSFLGTPGVSQYKELEKVLAALKRKGLMEVQEYYDMDKFMDIRCGRDYKPDVCLKCEHGGGWEKDGICVRKEQKREQIRAGCVHLYEICGRLGLKCIRKTWDFTPDGLWAGNWKGIDDYWCEKKRRERGTGDDMDRAPAVYGGIPSCSLRDPKGREKKCGI